MQINFKYKKLSSGMTLVELMIGMLILSIAVLTLIGTFENITKGIFVSRAKMLASNLAQEKMQILKQLQYYKILVTTSPVYNTDFTPAIPYDPGNFPPEQILEGGMTFTRLTYVQVIQEINGEIVQLPPTPDTGMKLITVTVIWEKIGRKQFVQIKSIASNPDMYMTNSFFKGRVKNILNSQPISDANVIVAENIGWRDITDASGNYSISVQPGTYILTVNARGYFPANVMLSITSNQTITQDFDLMPMSSGTVRGTAWINNHIVISQVVASTQTQEGFDQEYLELFNPTTWTWQIAIDSTTPVIGMKYQGKNDASPKNIELIYYNLILEPNSYYLIANTTTITCCGVTKIADAVYDSDNSDFPNIIKCREDTLGNESWGGLGIYYCSNDSWIDRVGWDASGVWKTATIYETDGIDQTIGFQRNEQYIRRTSTSGYIESNFGRCYDSDNNNTDFLDYVNMVYPPKNTSDRAQIISGVPAIGAIVSCNDGLSGNISINSVGFPPTPEFNLTSVATGTWVILITSGQYSIEISSVMVLANSTTGILNGITFPKWNVVGYNCSFLYEEMTEGYISGRITNVYGQVISPPVNVTASFQTVTTNNNGYYFIKLPTGTYNVIANSNPQNLMYVSAIRENINVFSGQITSGIDFILSQGGQIYGFVTRDGLNPIPSVVFVAKDAYGSVRGDGLSGTDGKFTIINLSTGTYYISPVLGSGEVSNPYISTRTITAGSQISAGTFTITGVFGRITGNVISDGKPISIGVLIIASTSTILTPPTISAATLTGAPYYITSSYEDGTYIIDVRGGVGTYNLYGYYTTFSGDIPYTTSKSITNILVNAGQTVSNQNLIW